MLFNGGALESFQPTRVIRQGDPFSSYLFILCMEVLGTLIVEKCEESCGTPCRLPGGVAFSHLFFTDDLILFAKADVKNCMAIRDVLDNFCMLSGQKFSAEKSRMFFSPNLA